jgi:cytosine/uracil/thiamine/allantoin permease
MLKNITYVQKIWIIVIILLSLFLFIWALRQSGLYEGFEEQNNNNNMSSQFSVPIMTGGSNIVKYPF